MIRTILLILFLTSNFLSTLAGNINLLSGFDKFNPNIKYDTTVAQLTYRGVTIYTYPRHDMFNEDWYDSPINAKVQKIEEGNRARAFKILKTALDKYPESFLKNNLESVYLLGKLNFYNMDYGGTYYDKSVFMCVKDESAGYDSDYVEKTFHHEFSSILFLKYSIYFDKDEWLAANKPSFEYGTGGVDAMRKGEYSLTWKSTDHMQGFLNQYSMSSIEEDFNEICGALLTSREHFWSTIDVYPRLKQKVKTAINFYHSIDKTFTEEYFRGLEKN